MQNPKNITKHELIGLIAKVTESKSKKQIGLKGKIIDETANMIKISTNKGEKKIVKKDVTLELSLLNKRKVKIKGKLLVGKPEIRIKKRITKKRV